MSDKTKNEITIEFIKSEMKDLNITRNEICEDFGIGKATLSVWLNPDSLRQIRTAPQKAAFRYYFLYRRLDRRE